MAGEAGNDTLVDGPLSSDQLQGNGDNDTLFSHDFKSFDHNFGQEGFDQLTMDEGDFGSSFDIERINVIAVGRLRLSPAPSRRAPPGRRG
jgi:hypothetical protein